MKQVTKLNQNFDPTGPTALPAGVLDSTDTRINPATEETLGLIYARQADGTAKSEITNEMPTGPAIMADSFPTVQATDQFGEVQATPTANTLLGRLKDLLTELQAKADLSETQPVSPIYTAATPYKLVSAATTNATSLKASAGVIYGIQLTNVNASPRYLKLYNKASAPTVGTDTPVKTLIIPGNDTGAGSNVPIPVRGINFSTGIAFAITTGAADNDTGAVAASEIIVNIDYI